MAPYIDFQFCGDVMQRMHDQYGHLSYANLVNILESLAWWERPSSIRLHLTISGMGDRSDRSFAQDNRRNWWIITAINYVTGWPIAKAIPKAMEEAMVEFIYNGVYMNYGAPQKIFMDGRKNLWGGVPTSFCMVDQKSPVNLESRSEMIALGRPWSL